MPRKNWRAFTLVELLVVIGIISILMSILFPALARVRHQALLTSCGSNLRQLGIMLHTYAANNRGLFPARVNNNYNYILMYYQGDDRDLFRPYARLDNLFACPYSPYLGTLEFTPSVAVCSDYELWFWFKSRDTGKPQLRKVGDYMRVEQDRFRVLACDRYLPYPNGGEQWVDGSHPARRGRAGHLQSEPNDPVITYSTWSSPNASVKGVDRNFLMDDGSVQMLADLTLEDGLTINGPDSAIPRAPDYRGLLPPAPR